MKFMKEIYSASKKETIVETVHKERKLLEKLDKMMNKEARSLNDKLIGLYSQEMGLRPEVERWMMRCEKGVGYEIK